MIDGLKIFLKLLYRLLGLFMLQLTLIAGVIFEIFKDPTVIQSSFPDDYEKTFPYFCNDIYFWARGCLCKVELYPDTHAFFIFQHVCFFILSLYILLTGRKFFTALAIFAIIHLINIPDYLIIYGQAWFNFGHIPISWDVIKNLMFGMAIFYEAGNELEKIYNENRLISN